MNKEKHFSILDEILKTIINNTDTKGLETESIVDELLHFDNKIHISIYLSELENKEYIYSFTENCKNTDYKYKATLNGVLFSDSGGFLQQHKSEKNRKISSLAINIAKIINAAIVISLMYATYYFNKSDTENKDKLNETKVALTKCKDNYDNLKKVYILALENKKVSLKKK